MTKQNKDYTRTTLKTTLLVYLALLILATGELVLLYYINQGLV